MLITGIVYILNLFLKMLIIFAGTPTAAPGEAMLYKKLVSKVGFVDLIRKILFSVRIGFHRHPCIISKFSMVFRLRSRRGRY